MTSRSLCRSSTSPFAFSPNAATSSLLRRDRTPAPVPPKPNSVASRPFRPAASPPERHRVRGAPRAGCLPRHQRSISASALSTPVAPA
ncbi:hypothetical protein BRADI_4g33133v3 [Brachypodium distachyon]|uniref:Uncharacterized protein n=1 Tax=Brachypodium distachyon TaxID=15368 RepID=A0A0Q3IX64_BRADI|nr:hypothetical protein BRADI_4g33133v3 [Brachypodium distachyon]